MNRLVFAGLALALLSVALKPPEKQKPIFKRDK